jgi:hypothetical protein
MTSKQLARLARRVYGDASLAVEFDGEHRAALLVNGSPLFSAYSTRDPLAAIGSCLQHRAPPEIFGLTPAEQQLFGLVRDTRRFLELAAGRAADAVDTSEDESEQTSQSQCPLHTPILLNCVLPSSAGALPVAVSVGPDLSISVMSGDQTLLQGNYGPSRKIIWRDAHALSAIAVEMLEQLVLDVLQLFRGGHLDPTSWTTSKRARMLLDDEVEWVVVTPPPVQDDDDDDEYVAFVESLDPKTREIWRTQLASPKN